MYMRNNLLNEYENSNKQFNSTLDTYSMQQLITFYIEYAHVKQFEQHENMEEILNYMSSYIIKNLPKLSFIEILDIYSKIAVKEKEILTGLQDNKHRINGILFESVRKKYQEQNAKSKGMTVEDYKIHRNSDLREFEDFIMRWTPIYSLVSLFRKDILSYLNTYVCSVSDVEKEDLLNDINIVVEENSKKIDEGTELKNDRKKRELYSRFKSNEEMFKIMNTSELEEQNNICLNYIDVLNNLYKGNSK